jgi:hypothetical protein
MILFCIYSTESKRLQLHNSVVYSVENIWNGFSMFNCIGLIFAFNVIVGLNDYL